MSLCRPPNRVVSDLGDRGFMQPDLQLAQCLAATRVRLQYRYSGLDGKIELRPRPASLGEGGMDGCLVLSRGFYGMGVVVVDDVGGVRVSKYWQAVRVIIILFDLRVRKDNGINGGVLVNGRAADACISPFFGCSRQSTKPHVQYKTRHNQGERLSQVSTAGMMNGGVS